MEKKISDSSRPLALHLWAKAWCQPSCPQCGVAPQTAHSTHALLSCPHYCSTLPREDFLNVLQRLDVKQHFQPLLPTSCLGF